MSLPSDVDKLGGGVGFSAPFLGLFSAHRGRSFAMGLPNKNYGRVFAFTLSGTGGGALVGNNARRRIDYFPPQVRSISAPSEAKKGSTPPSEDQW